MAWDEETDETIYRVVVNHEEQYSIWPERRQPPAGWRDAGKIGSKAECLEYIDEVWTDMRPLSLRKKMEEMKNNPPPEVEPAAADSGPLDPRDDLVSFLARGKHPVELGLRPNPSVAALEERLNLGYVHVRFTDTRGGTEIGVRLDPHRTDTSQANFESGSGPVHLSGTLKLNGIEVRCNADIELESLRGQGNLEIIGE